jgi:hypothetical protein
MGAGPSQKPDRSHLRDHDEVLMQPIAAFSGIEELRSKAGPKINQLTAPLNPMRGLRAEHSRGARAAAAARAHAGRKQAVGVRLDNHNRSSRRRQNLHKARTLGADSVDQLNFEFARNKNSMTVFMLRLRRVYHN